MVACVFDCVCVCVCVCVKSSRAFQAVPWLVFCVEVDELMLLKSGLKLFSTEQQ